MTVPEFGRFFLPGPTEVHPDILKAMQRPMIPHRGQQMVDLLKGLEAPLKQLCRTERNVLIGTCAATGFMEMAVRSGVRHRALCLAGGAFGERFAGIVAATGREVVRLEVALGRTVEPDMLRDALRRSDADAVTLVHSETSTGALAPLEELAHVVHEFDDVMLLVDAVTSMGGCPVETDEWDLDFVFTGSQKALALPPGLALGVASERMLENAKNIPERGAYLDVVAFHKAAANYQPTNTPALSQVYALEAQLSRIDAEGGVEARWRRHDEMRRVVEEWVCGPGGELGFTYLPREDRRSWTVSCLRVPEGVNGRQLVHAMKREGWTIGTGYGELRHSTIRIGHMGDHTPAGVRELLGALESVVP
ncbi:MAG: aminotransferase class V-fold PLP-dependent enzyme [Gemmatimonadales bacterium]|nr:aminotransferase class V-fold PLP-dependent enzyme [Gemmatimonadales bacterium]NIN11110.1 aminotransferase class V-fold PLP-dependent enzyme [Gemmatimonadales bacterium]NIN49707.1 aminotransferase class V-fold PLP-dependent enzyme [Gemmatimonadales bacterium]NIP07171.1 aminotransferase class V-fold PLP-dependent enzyme [Gemmatimonadales bacterium]NIQ99563.1 aminotransferase class V-fold PLP-dependent enzyme [Gemmatimonadales bacterium]